MPPSRAALHLRLRRLDSSPPCVRRGALLRFRCNRLILRQRRQSKNLADLVHHAPGLRVFIRAVAILCGFRAFTLLPAFESELFLFQVLSSNLQNGQPNRVRVLEIRDLHQLTNPRESQHVESAFASTLGIDSLGIPNHFLLLDLVRTPACFTVFPEAAFGKLCPVLFIENLPRAFARYTAVEQHARRGGKPGLVRVELLHHRELKGRQSLLRFGCHHLPNSLGRLNSPSRVWRNNAKSFAAPSAIRRAC